MRQAEWGTIVTGVTESIHRTGAPRANRLAELFAPAFVDVFAGCGGWSAGQEQAFVEAGYDDKYIDLMINHWDVAVGVHQLNHPLTQHLRANVLEVDPNEVLLGRQLLAAHFSPDCTDHSKAKGDKPRRKEIRALADIVPVWLAKRRPLVATLENVEEFQQWGPLVQKKDKHGRFCWNRIIETTVGGRTKTKHVAMVGPKMGTKAAADFIMQAANRRIAVEPHLAADKKRRGELFRKWIGKIESLGYVVEWRELRACDYGAPTTRKRLFVIMRCDRRPIVWPEATHGSVARTGSRAADRRAREGGRDKRSGHEEEANGQGAGESEDRAREGDHRRSDSGFVGGGEIRREGSCGRGPCDDDPTAGDGCRERTGQLKPFRTAAQCIDWQTPMLSIFATRPQARAWAATQNIGKQKHERIGVPQRPLQLNTQKRLAGGLFKWALTHADPFIVNIENYGWNSSADGRPVSDPLSTITASPRGGKHALADVELASFAGTLNHEGGERTTDLRDPMHTVTGTRDARAVVGATLAGMVARTDNKQSNAGCMYPADQPLTTITSAAGHAAVGIEVSPFIAGAVSADKPLATVMTNDRRAVAAVQVAPFTAGVGGRAGQSAPSSVNAPLPTVTGKADRVIGAAELVPFSVPRYGEREGQAPRSTSINQPMPTIVGTGNQGSLAAVSIVKHNGGPNGHITYGTEASQPLDAITSKCQQGLIAAHLTQYHNEPTGALRGQAADDPLKTLDTQNRFGVVAAHVVKFRGESVGNACDEPLPTVTSGAGAARDAGAAHAMGVACAYLSHMYSSSKVGGNGDPADPIKSVTAQGNHASVCVIYLSPYYGNEKEGRDVGAPMPTVVSKERFGLIGVDTLPGSDSPEPDPVRHFILTAAGLSRAKKVAIWARRMLGKKVDRFLLSVRDEAGKVFKLLTMTVRGALHLMTDILMRMLKPRELARAQGFDDSYVIDRMLNPETGKEVRISKADQVKLIGNSVPPAFAKAITKANIIDAGLLGPVPGKRRMQKAGVAA